MITTAFTTRTNLLTLNSLALKLFSLQLFYKLWEFNTPTAKLTTPTSSEAAQRDENASDTVVMGDANVAPISEVMRATTESKVAEKGDNP